MNASYSFETDPSVVLPAVDAADTPPREPETPRSRPTGAISDAGRGAGFIGARTSGRSADAVLGARRGTRNATGTSARSCACDASVAYSATVPGPGLSLFCSYRYSSSPSASSNDSTPGYGATMLSLSSSSSSIRTLALVPSELARRSPVSSGGGGDSIAVAGGGGRGRGGAETDVGGGGGGGRNGSTLSGSGGRDGTWIVPGGGGPGGSGGRLPGRLRRTTGAINRPNVADKPVRASIRNNSITRKPTEGTNLEVAEEEELLRSGGCGNEAEGHFQLGLDDGRLGAADDVECTGQEAVRGTAVVALEAGHRTDSASGGNRPSSIEEERKRTCEWRESN